MKNELQLISVDADKNDYTYQPIDIVIDGKSLIAELFRIETPLAKAEGTPEIAGSYSFPSRKHLSHFYQNIPEDKTTLLYCSCGCGGCWDFDCKVTITEEAVIWSDFEQIHRDWNYTELGSFVFDKNKYDEVFAEIIV